VVAAVRRGLLARRRLELVGCEEDGDDDESTGDGANVGSKREDFSAARGQLLVEG
jgi:hypothetical protein